MARIAVLAAAVLLIVFGLKAIAQRPFPSRDVIPPGSRVEYKSLDSKILGRQLRYGLHLPGSYATSKQSYPVLYFLHGANENEMRWSTRGETDLMLDRMVQEKQIGEFIVAVPFGENSFYTNARAGGERWEDMIIQEFIPMIESTYRVKASRAARGISGISMGGYGALKLAMKNPNLFGSVSAHSAMLIKDFPPDASGGRRMQMFYYLFDRIFGISESLVYWDENNPIVLAQSAKKFNRLKIYFDCGTEDEFGFFVGAKQLSEELSRASYPHEFHLYPGDHGWDYARQHTPESLKFHWNAFNGGSK